MKNTNFQKEININQHNVATRLLPPACLDGSKLLKYNKFTIKSSAFFSKLNGYENYLTAADKEQRPLLRYTDSINRE